MQPNKKIMTGLLSILLITGCLENDKNATKETEGLKVQVLRVEAKDIPLDLEYSARAQGYKQTQVRAQVGGILLKRHYKEGSRVNAGDVLFEIDPAPYKVALSQAKAHLAEAEAEYQSAQSDWKRISTLYKQKVVSEKSRDDAQSALNMTKAAVQVAQAQVEKAELDLGYTTVKAPISGITSLEDQSEGSLISVNGDAGLLTSITQVDPIYVIFNASESEILSLTTMNDKGMIADPSKGKAITAKVKLSNDTYYPLNGKINFINPTIDENTGTIKLRAVFPNPEGRLRPGQFLRLVMEGLIRKDAIVVPEDAVMQGAKGPFVYKISDKGTVEIANIKTGFTTQEEGWVVDEGLKDGDLVIISDLMKIRQGIPVKAEIVNEPKKEEIFDADV